MTAHFQAKEAAGTLQQLELTFSCTGTGMHGFIPMLLSSIFHSRGKYLANPHLLLAAQNKGLAIKELFEFLRFIAEERAQLEARKRQSIFSGEMPGLQRGSFGWGQVEKLCLCQIPVAVDGSTSGQLKELVIAGGLFIPLRLFGSMVVVLQLAWACWIVCYFLSPCNERFESTCLLSTAKPDTKCWNG